MKRTLCNSCGETVNEGLCNSCCQKCQEVREITDGEFREEIRRTISRAIDEISDMRSIKAISTLRKMEKIFLTKRSEEEKYHGK